MMRLLRVELTRFRSRRFNRMAVLGVLAVALIIIFGAWEGSRPPSESDVANFNSAVQDWEKNGDQYIADCEAAQESNPDEFWGCDMYVAPTMEQFSRQSPTFADSAAGVLPSFGLLLVFAAFAMGVSFIAAEFSSGAIGNWLTFEPRRGRVYGTKVGASGLAVIPLAIVTGALVVAGTWLVMSLNDHVGTVTGEVWSDVAQSGLRLVLVTAAFGVLGVAMGTIVRHTAAAIGILIGYLIVVEMIIGGLFRGLQPWLLRLNLQAVLDDGASYYALECEPGAAGQQVCSTVEKVVSLGQGAVVLSVLLIVVALVAALVFRRRDVN